MALSYGAIKRAGLGAHLAVIVILAIIPTSVLVVEFIDSKRRAALSNAEAQVSSMARDAADRHRHQVEVLNGLFRTAALVVADDDFRDDCSPGSGDGPAAVRLELDGTLSCQPLDPAWAMAPILAEASSPDDITISYHGGGLGQSLDVRAAAHVQGEDGQSRILHMDLPFDWVSQIIDQPTVTGNVVIAALHGPNGRLVARYRRNDGTALGGIPADSFKALWASLMADTSATRVMTDVDGVERIFGRANVPETGIVFIAGVSHEEVLSTAQSQLIADLAMLGGVLAVSALVVWFLLERTILRSIRQLRDAAVATANGEFGKRIDIADGPAELRELGSAFNEMTSRLEKLALHDALTGLANRRLLSSRFEELVAEGRPFAALEVDLDGFKQVNDTHGHAVGDRVLADVARRIQGCLSPLTIAARIGGDEFLILVPVDGAESLREKTIELAESLIAAISSPYPLRDGEAVAIGASIGIGFWPQNGRTAETLFRTVDEALYQAKRSGRNRCFIVSPVSAIPGASDDEAAA